MAAWKALVSIASFQFISFVIILYFLLCEVEDLNSRLSSVKKSASINISVNSLYEHLLQGSSAWCFGSTKSTRQCKFKNICYHRKWDEFIFFHGSLSVRQGVPENRFDPALLDFSSVEEHNTKYFNYLDMPVAALRTDFKDSKFSFIPGTSIMFHRFNPENLMHVLHDDLIPLFHTMTSFTFSEENWPFDAATTVIFMDGRKDGPWYELYQHYSRKKLFKKDDLASDITCFDSVLIGLTKDTTWYQYGFQKPQGPIENFKARKSHINHFVKHMRRSYQCSNTHNGNKGKYVVLISRKNTRLILNEARLSIVLADMFHSVVHLLELEQPDINHIICFISGASALIGMHGAALALSMFLPQDSSLIELFPYGVNPENYTPYKTLANIIGIRYISWQNTLLSNTISHPEWPPELGGIQHLTEDIQRNIIDSTEVPPHLCCYDPHWLYRIYQDTTVDIPSFVDKMQTLFGASQTIIDSVQMYPGAPVKTNCSILEHSVASQTLHFTWLEPVNAKYVRSQLKYQLWLQCAHDKEQILAYEVAQAELKVAGLSSNCQYRGWVRCVTGNVTGPFTSVIEC